MLSKKEFDRTTDGDDVFFSEWGYAKDEKRFRRLRVGLVEGVGNEGEFGAVGLWECHLETYCVSMLDAMCSFSNLPGLHHWPGPESASYHLILSACVWPALS